MIYVPNWIDFLLLFVSFMIGYELYRKDYTARRAITKYFVLIVVCVMMMILVTAFNAVASWRSLALFICSALCLIAAIYLRVTAPRKLPDQPLPD